MMKFSTFFSYYGSKAKLAKLYPRPKYGAIVEPFAGAACYSVLHFENDVFLNDYDPNIVDTWRYLQRCSPKDILGLPKFRLGMDLRKLNLSREERLFCGWWANLGSRRPVNFVSAFAANNDGFEEVKRKVAANLYRIKHFRIHRGRYDGFGGDRIRRTWFVDPPYQVGGSIYRACGKTMAGPIEFGKLRKFLKTRPGLIIVCENDSASWMKFNTLAVNPSGFSKTVEVLKVLRN